MITLTGGVITPPRMTLYNLILQMANTDPKQVFVCISKVLFLKETRKDIIIIITFVGYDDLRPDRRSPACIHKTRSFFINPLFLTVKRRRLLKPEVIRVRPSAIL
jgi:hypothetical protein